MLDFGKHLTEPFIQNHVNLAENLNDKILVVVDLEVAGLILRDKVGLELIFDSVLEMVCVFLFLTSPSLRFEVVDEVVHGLLQIYLGVKHKAFVPLQSHYIYHLLVVLLLE